MKPTFASLLMALLGIVACFAARPAAACTAFQLQSRDGAWVYFRSMEFGFPLDSQMLIVPRGTKFTGTAPGGAAGLEWSATYGYVGPNQEIATNQISDGMNERGLVVGMLLFPGFAQYPEVEPKEFPRTIGSWEVASYLLSTCATVAEAREMLTDGSVVVANAEFGPFRSILPVHYYVADATGAVLIAEYVGGKLQLHDNPLGVLTNSPTFDWHLTNLMNFTNLTPANVPTVSLGREVIKNAGQGTGALGLPGDYTPSSRFVRAALFSSWATPPATAAGAVLSGFHVLNTFDIFQGAIRTTAAHSAGTVSADATKLPEGSIDDVTQWVIAHDRSNLRTYIRTYESLAIEMVDLKQIDFASPGLRQITLDRAFAPRDVTGQAKPASAK